MRLPAAPVAYNQTDQNALRHEIERTDSENAKRNLDAQFNNTSVKSLTVNGVPYVPGTGGTVTSVAASLTGATFTGPVTSSGTLAGTWNAQAASAALIAPTGGGVPTFRALVAADIPALNYVTSVSGSGGTTGLTLTGGPITSAGTLTLGGTLAIANGGTGATTAAAARTALGAGTGNGSVTSVAASLTGVTFTGPVTSSGTLAGTWNSQALGLVFASPAGASGSPTFRAINITDLPIAVSRATFTNTAVSTQIANTTADTPFSITTTIPANSLAVGSRLRIKASGRFNTTGVSPTLKWTLNTAGAASTIGGPIAVFSPGSNLYWDMEIDVQVTSIGVSGSLVFNGKVLSATGPTTAATAIGCSPATLTRNTTAAIAISISAQWGTASVSNNIVMDMLTVEQLN